MDRICRIVALSLIAISLWAADFRSGQAARAVIGQSSFSSRQASITPVALALVNNRLFAADASRRVLTYDLTQILGAKDDLGVPPASGCALCGFAPVASTPQGVLPGIASFSSFGKAVVVADTVSHRVLVWRDASSPRAAKGPDVILGRSNPDEAAISGSTLVDPVSVVFDGKHLFVGDASLHRILVWNSLPSSDAQPADAVLGQPTLTSLTADDVPGPDTISQPAALASDGTNLYVADTVDHRILVFTAGDTVLNAQSVLNSASLAAGPLAPGTLVAINGQALSDATESASESNDEPLPARLGGVEVLLDGTALPLLSISPTELR